MDDRPTTFGYVKCLSCLKDSSETKEMETWHNHTNGYTWHICEKCEQTVEDGLENGELYQCTECEMPCNYDEVYTIAYHNDGDYCDDCYDKIWQNASKETVEACQIFTHESHVETYGTGFPKTLRNRHCEAWLYRGHGRKKHEDCFIHPLEYEMTVEDAILDFQDNTDPDIFQEFIFTW